MLDDLAYQAVLPGRLGVEPEVAACIVFDLLEGLACLAGEEAVDALAHAEDLAGLDLDVGGAAAGAAPGLVQEEAGVREAEAVLARGCDVDERGGAGDPAAAD